MTRPRRVLPGTTYLITRRCSERRPFLAPSPETNGCVLFVLALAARRYGVLVHAFCVLSNHFHLVVTDVHGTLPAFMQYLDSLVARAMNARLGRFEAFWATGGSYNAVEPLDRRAVIEKIAYVLANPVAAGLVSRGAEWPGLWSGPDQIGGASLTAQKPDFFFKQKGSLPDSLELALAVPDGFASAAEFRSLLAAELAALEQQHAAARGGRFLGAKRVRAQDPLCALRGGEPRFGLHPRVATRDAPARADGLKRLGDFEGQYRRARARWRTGDRTVVFPAGTYLMRLQHGAVCAAAA